MNLICLKTLNTEISYFNSLNIEENILFNVVLKKVIT